MKKCGGMARTVKVDFFKICLFLYRSWMFTTEEAFQTKFSIFYKKFSVYPQAKQFIDKKFVLKREKSVAFYTKHIFTAGQTSGQRSESLNNLIKGFGSLKKKMVQWSIYQLMTWLDRCVERIYIEMFLEIKKITMMQKKVVNFGPSGWMMFGKDIVLMLLSLIQLKIYMPRMNIHLYLGCK